MTQPYYQDRLFELVPCSPNQTREIVDSVLNLTQVAIDMADVKRVPRYNKQSRENNAEHSYMLTLVAAEIARTHFPYLDDGLVSKFASVHDLPELETCDVATFHQTTEQANYKTFSEKLALQALRKRLPRYTFELLERYEAQIEPEARLVRFIDKLLPVAVDILGPGSMVMHEDYKVLTHHELDRGEQALRERFARMFPEDSMTHLHAARTCLSELFALTFNEA